MSSDPQPPRGTSASPHRPEFWKGWCHLWDAPATNWATIDANTAYSQGPAKGDTFAAVWQVIRREFPQLIRPTPAAANEFWRMATVRHLMSQVQAAAPSGQRFMAQRRVAEVLDAGNRLGRWRIPIPDIPAPLPPAPRSPFQHTSFAQMVHFEPLVEQTLAAFAEAPPNDDPEAYWGRLFLSALLFGALLRPGWLWALPSALEQPPGHCLWMELRDTPKDECAPQHQRWYPDPLTRLNLVRARADQDRPEPPSSLAHSGPNAYRCIRAFARTAGIVDTLPNNWSQLVSVVQTRFALYLPAYLLGHARGANTATSWPATVQQRLQTPRHAIDCNPPHLAPATKERPADSVAASEEDAEELDKSTESETAPAALRELASRIRRHDPPDAALIEAWLVDYRQTPQPLKSIERIGEWVAGSLCRKPKKGRRRLRGRTVYALYNAAAARLVGQLADADPAAFECSDDYIEIYTTTLDDAANASTRKTLARALASFHAHLVAFHNAPEEPMEVLRTPRLGQKEHQTPNANFVDEASFKRAIEWIDFRYAQTPQRGTLLVLLASLGFYAGLRRSEAAGVLVKDLDGAPAYDLVIRPNAHRLLKSSNARRVLPLKALLPESILERLINWQRDRRAECIHAGVDAAQNSALLAPPDQQHPFRNNAPIFTELTQALAQAAGDASLRYHHLRHSFASRLLVQLWEAEADPRSAHPPWAQKRPIEDLRSLRQSLIGQAVTQRRSLRLIARMLGHADTTITVEHYLHTLDDLLGRGVRRVTDDLTPSQISAVTGLSTGYIRTIRKEIGQDAPPSVLLDLITDRQLPQAERYVPSPPHTGAINILAPDDLLAYNLLLTDAINHQYHADGTAQRFAYPWSEATLTAYIHQLERLPSGMRRRPRDKEAEGPLLEPPTTPAEKTLAREVWAILDGDPVRGIPPMRNRDRTNLLDTYRRGHRPGRLLTVRIDTLPTFKRWIGLLEALGLITDFIAYHTPKPSSDVGSAETQRLYWSNKAQIPILPDPDPPGFNTDAPNRGYVTVTSTPDANAGTYARAFGAQYALTVAWMCREERSRGKRRGSTNRD